MRIGFLCLTLPYPAKTIFPYSNFFLDEPAEVFPLSLHKYVSAQWLRERGFGHLREPGRLRARTPQLEPSGLGLRGDLKRRRAKRGARTVRLLRGRVWRDALNRSV